MQYKVSVTSGMVTVELGLLRQNSRYWMSFTQLERSTMAATKAQTLMPFNEKYTGQEEKPDPVTNWKLVRKLIDISSFLLYCVSVVRPLISLPLSNYPICQQGKSHL